MKMRQMSQWLPTLLAALAMMAMTTARCPAAANAEDLALAKRMSKAFAAVSEGAMPAVVSIRVEKTFEAGGRRFREFNDPFEFFGDDFLRRFFPDAQPESPRRFKQLGQGSGFLISKDGYILTNNHVVGDADKIRVRLHDGREFDAKRIGSDPKSEVAVIKIEGDDFPCLRRGDSSALEIGEWVIAIGNPFGLAESVTVGVVSAKGRSNMNITDYEDFIQTDAAINPGNSGGPLVNLNGEAVGINTAIFSRSGGYQGIGFAIPINMADSIRDQLVRTGRVIRGYLGVHIQEMTPDLAESFGLKERGGILVADVEPDSPAAKAGLKQADVILKLNGREVEGVNSFRNDISATAPGTSITLTVRRDDRAMDLKARTGTLAADATAEAAPDTGLYEQLGMTVTELTATDAKNHRYGPNEGVLVSEVDPDGVAAAAGIKPGNLISTVNRKRVANLAEFMAALGESGDSNAVLLGVKDGRYSRYLVLRVE